MKRRRGMVRKDIARRGLVKWCILISLITGLLGISYAAHTNVLYGVLNLSTSNMSFIFDSGNSMDTAVQLQNGSDGTVKDLGGKVTYKDKKLSITDIGPIDVEDLADGNAIITIKYLIKSEDKEKGIKRPAEVKHESDQGYDLGMVEFDLMSHTPVWNLENDSRSWGTKSEGIDGTPAVIYDYLPKNLGEFHAYNKLVPDHEDGMMAGTLTLKQESSPDLPDSMEIGLSSLQLPDDIIKDLKNGSPESTLLIKGTYGFAIPLDLEQFNVER